MYKQVTYWVAQYGSAGMPDNRAVQDYITCETNEAINTLRNELVGISQGKYTDENLDKLVGIKRRTLHKSYQDWAKSMLMWIAANYRGS